MSTLFERNPFDIFPLVFPVQERVDFTITASYDAPVEKVIAALKEAAKVPTILEDKAPFAALNRYGDHSMEYILQVWTATDDFWTTTFAINENIKKVFDANGIEMTYPHLNVHFDKIKFPDNFPFNRS